MGLVTKSFSVDGIGHKIFSPLMGLVTKSFSVDGIGHKIFVRGWDWSQNLAPLMGLVTKSLSVDGIGHKYLSPWMGWDWSCHNCCLLTLASGRNGEIAIFWGAAWTFRTIFCGVGIEFKPLAMWKDNFNL